MADRGDGDGPGALIQAVYDQVGQARHGKTAQAPADMAARLRGVDKQAQRRCKLRLNVSSGLRVTGRKVRGNAVEVGFGTRGKSQLQG